MPASRFPRPLLCLLIMAYAVSLLWVNAVLPDSPTLTAIVERSGGLINRTLIGNLLLLAVTLIVLLGIGRRGAAELGLRRDHLHTAALLIPLLWLSMQGIDVLTALSVGQTLQVDPVWSQGVTGALGLLIAQIAGNALCEEIVFRGVLMVQLARWMPRRPRLAAALALALFVLAHLPNRLARGYTPTELLYDALMLATFGALFMLVYARTGNLFLATGVHSLINAPTMLFDSGLWPENILLVLVIGALTAWPHPIQATKQVEAAQYH
jgi:uncharacterized protein